MEDFLNCKIFHYLGLSRYQKIMWMLIDGKGVEIITYMVVFVLYVRIKLFLNTKVMTTLRIVGSLENGPSGPGLKEKSVDTITLQSL